MAVIAPFEVVSATSASARARKGDTRQLPIASHNLPRAAVRYVWATNPESANLYNRAGLLLRRSARTTADLQLGDELQDARSGGDAGAFPQRGGDDRLPMMI